MDYRKKSKEVCVISKVMEEWEYYLLLEELRDSPMHRKLIESYAVKVPDRRRAIYMAVPERYYNHYTQIINGSSDEDNQG